MGIQPVRLSFGALGPGSPPQLILGSWYRGTGLCQLWMPGFRCTSCGLGTLLRLLLRLWHSLSLELGITSPGPPPTSWFFYVAITLPPLPVEPGPASLSGGGAAYSAWTGCGCLSGSKIPPAAGHSPEPG